MSVLNCVIREPLAMASAHAAVAKAFATVVRLNIVIVPSQKVLISVCAKAQHGFGRRCA